MKLGQQGLSQLGQLVKQDRLAKQDQQDLLAKQDQREILGLQEILDQLVQRPLGPRAILDQLETQGLQAILDQLVQQEILDQLEILDLLGL